MIKNNNKKYRLHLMNWSEEYLQARLRKNIPHIKPPPEVALSHAVVGRDTSEDKSTLVNIFVKTQKPETDWLTFRNKCNRWISSLLRETYQAEAEALNLVTWEFLNQLPLRERKILLARFGFNGKAQTLESIGRSLNLTREYIRQIEEEILQKIRLEDLTGKSPFGSLLRQAYANSRSYLYNEVLKSIPTIKGSEEVKLLCTSLLKNPPRMTQQDRMKEQKSLKRGELKAFEEHLNRLPEEEKEWLTGFLEGDGSLGRTRDSLYISFYQKDRRILDYIKTLLQTKRPVQIDQRSLHSLSFPNLDYILPLLELFSQSLVTPKYVQRLQDIRSLYNLNFTISIHKPTIPWICGFFDAEGCIHRQGPSLYMDFACKDQIVLEEIKEVIGGHISPKSGAGELQLRKDETSKFLLLWLKYSHNPQKQERLE